MDATTTQSASPWSSAIDELVSNLGSIFTERARQFDEQCQFVQANYDDLKEARFFSAAIPSELGGGGLNYEELCNLCTQLAQYCGSTALAFAMHSHPVALNVFKYRKGDEKAKATLTKIAANELIIAGTGANDWLSSNGSAVAVEGGYRVNAHKRFVSGGPGAQVLVSSVHIQTDSGEEVMHFSIPMNSPGVQILTNWKTSGMRGTGSNDVLLKDVFVPDTAIAARRPAGVWHPLWDTLIPIAMPVIVSTYFGMAQAASELAIRAARDNPALCALVGRMQNQLTIAQLAKEDMVRANNNFQFVPSLQNTERTLTRKTLATNAIREVVEQAAVIVGGSAFFQGHPLERIIRDVRAMHFHPLPEHKQVEFCGRIAMGMPAEKI